MALWNCCRASFEISVPIRGYEVCCHGTNPDGDAVLPVSQTSCFDEERSNFSRPNPDASLPFPTVASLNDPVFVSNSSDAPAIANVTDNISDAWGLRILDSDTILVYGAGLYSFFDDYSTFCCAAGNGEVCQRHIFQVLNSPGLSVYNLNTVGTTYEITLSGQDEAFYLPNVAGFIDNVALFRDSSAI